MRAFLALTPESDIAVEIADWSAMCWPSIERLVPVQNLHITMAYLGEIDEATYHAVTESLDSKDLGARITLCLDKVGYWPDANVLWLGCSETPAAINKLAATCKQVANRAGIRVSGKRFQPHITLARKPEFPPSAPLIDREFHLACSSLQLYQSVLDRSGARYYERNAWPLG